jgi:hypothetical protein
MIILLEGSATSPTDTLCKCTSVIVKAFGLLVTRTRNFYFLN